MLQNEPLLENHVVIRGNELPVYSLDGGNDIPLKLPQFLSYPICTEIAIIQRRV